MPHQTRGLLVTFLTASISGLAFAQPTGVSTTGATKEASASFENWPGGATLHGTRGGRRVEAAQSLPAGKFLLLVGGEYFRASDLFQKGDTNSRQAQHLNILWAPLAGFEIWLQQSMVSNRNSLADPATSQTLGDPMVGLKYSYPLTAELGVAGGASVLLPTSAQGSGLDAAAFSVNTFAAATYQVASWLAVSANGGFRLDNTGQIFVRQLSPTQRFAAGISTKNLILAGLGSHTAFALGKEMVLGPFAELNAGIAPGVDFSANPIRAAVGARWLPFGTGVVELTVGGEFALAGVPRRGQAPAALPGIPTWELFGQLATQLGPDAPQAPTAGIIQACMTDSDCGENGACLEGGCARVKEVVKEVTKEVTRALPTFSVQGKVLDQNTGDPVGNATVSFSGMKGSELAVDYRTGEFTSWPLAAEEGLVQITTAAAGYRKVTQTVPKGKPGDVVTLTFKMQPRGEAAKGEIRGSLKDARTGKAIRNGQVFIPALGKKLKTDKDGKFQATIKTGRYQVLISGRRYATQKKEIELRAGDVVILNVDMNPTR